MQKHMKNRQLFYDFIENGELPDEAGNTLFLHMDIPVKGLYDFPLKSRENCAFNKKRRKAKQLGIYIERV